MRPGLGGGGGGIDTDHGALATVLGEPDEHAGVCRACDRANHDLVEDNTKLLLLGAHLLREAHIAEAAIFVNGSSGWYRIGSAAP